MPPQSRAVSSIPTHHTAGHLDCPACELLRRRIVEGSALGSLTFKDAAPIWLRDHAADIARKTRRDYEYYIRTLGRFFDALVLEQIHVGHLHAYQAERSQAAGAGCVNHELNTLAQILDRAGLWSEIAKFYKPLKIRPSRIGRALTEQEEDRLFQTAIDPRWVVAYCAAMITATTTAGPEEISHLHVNDVDLDEREGAPLGTMRIRDGLKNGHRERTLPLNKSSRWAVTQLLRRYYRMCRRRKIQPHEDHYICWGRTRTAPRDPWRPMGSWKKAWRALCKAAGLPGLRYYDLRHHSATKMAEDPEISDATLEDMLGHELSAKMRKHYTHIRMKPKAQAVAKLELNIRAAADVRFEPRPEPAPRLAMTARAGD